MKDKYSSGYQPDFFDKDIDIKLSVRGMSSWPDQSRFPINISNEKAGKTLKNDFENSDSITIVTGYTSLDYIIDFLSKLDFENNSKQIKLLIGSEPFPGRREQYNLNINNVSQEINDYWLENGISLRLCQKIIDTKKIIESGNLISRYINNSENKLHGKIYISDNASILVRVILVFRNGKTA